MKKMLVVDDDEMMQSAIKRALRSRFEITSAVSIHEAETLDFCQFDIICLDACVPGDEINTEPLARFIRQSYAGPLVAISTGKSNNEKLLAAGCSHSCCKLDLLRFLRATFTP